MNRILGLTLLTFALMVAVITAQDEPAPTDPPAAKKNEPKQKKKALPEIRKLEKKDPAPEAATGEDVKKIIERLNGNMDSSEERLKKKDPGDDTRKVQGDIIKDLDKLINQQNQGGGGGGAGSASASSRQSQGAKGSSGGSSKGGDQSASSARGGGRSKGRSGSKGGQAKGGQSKGSQAQAAGGQKRNTPDKLGNAKDGAKGKGTQTAKAEPGKEGKGGGGMGGNPNAPKKKDNSTIGDLFKDVWGHLPLNKRQEMDAYARDRFLPKYDEILRQYYRTISEQSRHRDGD